MTSCVEIKLSDDKIVFSPGDKVRGNVIYNDPSNHLNGMFIEHNL